MSERKEDTEYLDHIKYALNVMNPIPLESLASHMKVEVDFLKELITIFIKKEQLNVKLIQGYIYYSFEMK